jgi:hypothetical protein
MSLGSPKYEEVLLTHYITTSGDPGVLFLTFNAGIQMWQRRYTAHTVAIELSRLGKD